MDLNERMARLQQTVRTETIKRNEEAERQRLILRAKKTRDWNGILERQPEIAEFVNDVAKEFGKPERVLIWENKELTLDSRNYDPLHDANKRRG